MAFLEWRKFNFFDLKKGVDDGKLAQVFKESDVTVTTNGNNQLVLGDTTGQIHVIQRNWQITTFQGYEFSVNLAYQLRNSPLLVTIGGDEPGINPLIKVWDTSRLDKNGIPYCHRITRAIPDNRPVNASALCVQETLQLMAVGFVDGSLLLFRGNIMRDRSSKRKLLQGAGPPITGLAFKISAANVFLFVATNSSVLVYNITHKDKEQKFELDHNGCLNRCSVLAESNSEGHFMIGRSNAIYCYNSDGRGPCYAVDGEKVMIEWFRSYLIIVAKTNRSSTTSSGTTTETSNDNHLITVLDIPNKFIVFTGTLTSVKALLTEWGAFYILDGRNNVYQLDEKDLQSKLALLFKKNLYDVAIRTAKSQQYDSDDLVDIFKQYGDHLYGKGDHAGAIEQYIKTIGKLEPSYVIRKFLDSQYIDKLTMYLQELHRQGHATEDHTTLLLNCYTKLNNTIGQSDSLKEFILMKDKDLVFEVDVAIKVCRQGSPAEALMLAKKYKKHDWYIKLQIEDHQKYADVIDYISNLDFKDAELYMKKYGHILIQHAPYESTEFLKNLCTNYKPQDRLLVSEGMLNGGFEIPERSDPEDYIHLFLNNSERLVDFLEYLISEGCILSTPVYDTLLEHYLYVWENLENEMDKTRLAQKILKLLQNPDVKYDKPQALVVCHMHSFSDGILYLYEEQKLYQQILRHHMSKKDTNAVLACCRRFGHQEPSLWIQALWPCIRDFENPPTELLSEIFNVLAKEHLLSPQSVIEAISTGQFNITLGHIRSYITNELEKEHKTISEITELTNKYQKDTEKLKAQLETLKSGAVVIQVSRCAACHHPLELPSLHFLCQHSYHEYCFQSFADNENECPACIPENKNLLELLKAFEYNKDLHETFHSQLDRASDGFSVAAEYFGRGVFNTYKLITDNAFDKNFVKPTPKTEPARGAKQSREKTKRSPVLEYGLGAEAKIRQVENARGKPAIVSASEGKVRVQEAPHGYGSSAEKGAKKFGGQSAEKRATQENEAAGTNPFDSDYDESKNPFNDEDYDDDKNPFKDDYDSDTYLNHFAS